MAELILDIDGTIWNTTGVVAGAWNKAVGEAALPELNGLTVTADMLKKEFGKPMDEIADDLFGDIDPRVKADLLKRCCVYEHDAIAGNTEDLTYENVRETLWELSERNNLYIVSNCQDGYIELVMSKNGITDIIKDFECFGHTGLLKADNIKLLMKRNGILDAVYIGDTFGDYISSREAGVKFAYASYGFGEVPEYDYLIDSFAEIARIW